MLTRRHFLGSTAAATSLALGACSQRPGSATMGPFGHLASRAKEAQPITAEEYVARQARARELMHTAGLDAIVVAEGTSLTYFTGRFIISI